VTPAQFQEARLSLGLTAAQLADILGKDIATVQRWETPAYKTSARKPDPTAVRVLQWMVDGFRPPQWPI
jgi:DNA-binding transcriptional regulator YiaG